HYFCVLFTCYDALSAILPLVLGLPHSYRPHTLPHSTFCHYACVVSYIIILFSHIYSNHGTSVFNPQVLCSHRDSGGSRSSDVRPQDGLRKVLREASLRKVRPLIARAAPAHSHKTNHASKC
ncbi:hypothetical protein EV702DRAFT_1131427, partial [Suillus placidus]